MSKKIFLVTGGLGCIGAWTIKHLLDAGHKVVCFDIGVRKNRLNALLTAEQKAAIYFDQRDISDYVQVMGSFEKHRVTHVVHLAALQIPFCRADPVMGAKVNVSGTVNVFEAARQTGVKHIAFASSAGAYGPSEEYPIHPVPHDAPLRAKTLYGVYKIASEGVSRLYAQDYGVSSTGIRPYTVYGVGRDQGLTSEPTKAILAAVKGKPYHISFGGTMQFQLATDVAQQFILAAEEPHEGSLVFNMGGRPTTVQEFADTLLAVEPSADITVGETILPFPDSFDDSALRAHASQVFETPLREGIQRTVEAFRGSN